MNRGWRLRVLGVLMLAGLQGACAPGEKRPAAPQDAAADAYETAPDFSLETLDGDTFRLSDQRGKIVVLNFWATWCGPCREEIPDFVELQEEFRDRGVLFVGISEDLEGREVVQPFATSFAINYPILLDADNRVSADYGFIQALPTTFVLDRAGRIRNRVVGALPQEALRPALESLVQEGEATAEAASHELRSPKRDAR